MKKTTSIILSILLVVSLAFCGYTLYSAHNIVTDYRSTKTELQETKDELDKAKREIANFDTDESELNHCPFCGNADVKFCVTHYSQKAGVNCYACGAQTGFNFETKEDAKKAWNSIPNFKEDNKNE